MRHLLLIAGLIALTGCATGTRVVQLGPLTPSDSLITLVVTEDKAVVSQECRDVHATGQVLGCQKSWPVVTKNPLPVRAMKIVRYTDALPSEMAMEIEAHELCHAVASLQLITDPCHVGNDGHLRAAVSGPVFTR